MGQAPETNEPNVEQLQRELADARSQLAREKANTVLLGALSDAGVSRASARDALQVFIRSVEDVSYDNGTWRAKLGGEELSIDAIARRFLKDRPYFVETNDSSGTETPRPKDVRPLPDVDPTVNELLNQAGDAPEEAPPEPPPKLDSVDGMAARELFDAAGEVS